MSRLKKLIDKLGSTESLNSPLRWVYDELVAIHGETDADWPFPTGKLPKAPAKKAAGGKPAKYPVIEGESKQERRRRLDRLRAEQKRQAAAE